LGEFRIQRNGGAKSGGVALFQRLLVPIFLKRLSGSTFRCFRGDHERFANYLNMAQVNPARGRRQKKIPFASVEEKGIVFNQILTLAP
jgi:hypothetical protein